MAVFYKSDSVPAAVADSLLLPRPVDTLVLVAGVLWRSLSASAASYAAVDVSGSVNILDGETLTFGTGADVVYTPDGTNVGVTGAGELRFDDDVLVISDPADPTKRARFDAGNIPTATLRVLTLPNADARLTGQVFASVAPETLQGAVVGAAEAAFTTEDFTIPADTLVAGTVIRIRAYATALDAAGISNLTLRIRIGGLAGTIVAASPTVDPITNDLYFVEAAVTIRTAGAGGTLVASWTGFKGTPATTFPTPLLGATQSTPIDTTVAQLLTATAEFSANNSDLRLDQLVVDIS